MRGTDLTWAGGESTFLLKIDGARALQQYCDAGPNWVRLRLGNGQWMVDDVVQTIRLGLEGGGMKKDEARKLTKLFVEDRPLAHSVPLACAILTYSLIDGDEEDQESGEDQAATRT